MTATVAAKIFGSQITNMSLAPTGNTVSVCPQSTYAKQTNQDRENHNVKEISNTNLVELPAWRVKGTRTRWGGDTDGREETINPTQTREQ